MGLRRKKDMSAMDIMAMSEELNAELSGAFVSKIFHRENGDVLLRLNAKSGRKDLLIRPGKWIFLAENPGENPMTASHFAMLLRKYMDNARVTAVKQMGFERIVEIHLFRGEEYRLYAELFSSGNVVLCDSKGAIRAVMKTGRWKDRVLRPNEIYRGPPSKIDRIDLEPEDIAEIMKNSSSDAVRTLITRFNLGPSFGEEVALRAGIDKGLAAHDITHEQCRRIAEAIGGLIAEIKGDRKPNMVFEEEGAVDACPVELRRYDGLKIEMTETFSAAIEKYVEAMPEEMRPNPEVERIKRLIEGQRETLEKYERESELYRKMADYMYENYGSFERLLSIIRERWESTDLREFRKWLAAEEMLHDLNPKDKTVKASINGHDYTLHFTEDVNYNSNLLYESSKKLREKARRGKEAVVESEKRLAEALKRGEETEKKRVARREKRFWFEKYRWFITSEGCLAMGGRDARSNEDVVAKRLRQGDRYVHADIHGAPSVVVRMENECSEQSLKEAGQFSLCMSKAWGADIGSGAAYWVTPEQVSKTPQAGEFLAKGAFVIRGKRNYFKDLELKLAVGEIEYDGVKKIVCAPPESLKAPTGRYVIIVPGKRRKEDVAREIAKLFDWPVDSVVSILPPGPAEIVEKHGFRDQNEADK